MSEARVFDVATGEELEPGVCRYCEGGLMMSPADCPECHGEVMVRYRPTEAQRRRVEELQRRCNHWWVPIVPKAVITNQPPPVRPNKAAAVCCNCGVRM